MITNAPALLSAIKRETFTGVILYQGPSMLDGAPIVAVANRIGRGSTNAKTGEMIQTFIIRSDVPPLDALRQGLDSSVCGDCLARPAREGFCYVNVGRSVAAVYGAFTRARYAAPGVDYDAAVLPELFRDSVFRMGAYGDPAAVPFDTWTHATAHARARNGYTHQWRRFPEFQAYCMASCDTAADQLEAKAAGWRTFRMRLSSEPLAKREIACPAAEESGKKTTCADCRACGGILARAKADIAIVAHGATARRYGAWRNASVAA